MMGETVAETAGVTMMMGGTAMETVLAVEISGVNVSARVAGIIGSRRRVGETVTKEGLMPAATGLTPARRISAGGQRSVRGRRSSARLRALSTSNAGTTVRA